MNATAFEFRYRFFIFTVIYWIGFALPLSRSEATVGEVLAGLVGHPTRGGVQFFFAVGGIVIALAAAIRTWATAYLQGKVVHDMAIHSDRLVADGPYRYVRNPLYLGTTLLSTGIGVMAAVPNYFFIVGATLLFNLRLIYREEAGLTAAQGESFLEFKKRVPRLIPTLAPRLRGSGRVPIWPQAFLAESFMWAFAVSQLLFALTLQRRIYFTILATTLGAYAIIHIINSQRQKRRMPS